MRGIQKRLEKLKAKAFSAKAQELAAKWAIDDAMLDSSQGRHAQIVTLNMFIPANGFAGPKEKLLTAIARANGCKYVLDRDWFYDPNGCLCHKAILVGYQSDCHFVKTLFLSLLQQAAQALARPEVLGRMAEECTWKCSKPGPVWPRLHLRHLISTPRSQPSPPARKSRFI